jgi:hypothetical protein
MTVDGHESLSKAALMGSSWAGCGAHLVLRRLRTATWDAAWYGAYDLATSQQGKEPPAK